MDRASVRCYPGLWLSKSANLAYAELSLNYINYTETTGKLQKGEGKNGISSHLTTATTEEWPKEVIEEIGRMFDYIQSCKNPQDISYEGYLKNGVVSVVTVVSGREIAIPEKSPVVLPSLPCSLEGDPVVRKEPGTLESDLLRVQERVREKEEHFKTPSKKPGEPITCAACGADLTGKSRLEKGGKFYCARPGCGYPERGCVDVVA